MSGLDFTGKVVVVSGSSRGLGKSLAIGYAKAGADVVISARSAGALVETTQAIRAFGRDVLAVEADVGTAEGCAKLAHQSLAWKGGVDVLVNNAGISEPTPFTESDDAHWEKILTVNLQSAVRLSRTIGASMLEKQKGNILMVGSVLGRTALPGNSSYFVSKAAIEQLARALALEWARKGVRVNCLAPGFFATEMVEEAQREGPFNKYVMRRTPMRRLGEANEMVEAALYLTSDAASFVTGTTLNVDGGWLAG